MCFPLLVIRVLEPGKYVVEQFISCQTPQCQLLGNTGTGPGLAQILTNSVCKCYNAERAIIGINNNKSNCTVAFGTKTS